MIGFRRVTAVIEIIRSIYLGIYHLYLQRKMFVCLFALESAAVTVLVSKLTISDL